MYNSDKESEHASYLNLMDQNLEDWYQFIITQNIDSNITQEFVILSLSRMQEYEKNYLDMDDYELEEVEEIVPNLEKSHTITKQYKSSQKENDENNDCNENLSNNNIINL